MAATKVRFHHADASGVMVEPIARFASANGTNIHGARRILQLWEAKGWIVRRKDGGFEVKKRLPRKDKWTLDRLREEGFPVAP